ncbi:MAG TPA: beta-ketoacyl synthase N-terminal-like domain-containing protein [Nitrospiria bacterium]|nr:beta-ketoacyl synthase N-terminal-like domain-containing protein [Nitrospiria bacterium]
MTDIAIIGMSCLYPGAPDLETYWNNIISKVDAVSAPPPEWEVDRYYDPDSTENDRIYCKRGGFLGELARFNPVKYGVMPNAVDGSEPDQFLALRIAHEALVDAGYAEGRVDRTRIEVILGRGTYINRGITNGVQHGVIIDQTLRLLKELHPEHTDEELAELKRRMKADLPPFNANVVPGLVPNIITGRVMNRLDFMGTNYLIDAACASSLIAIDHGLRDLESGRCDLAVVGGVHASLSPPIVMVFCQLNALSRKSQLRPFGKEPDGTLLGEGLGMIVLKRLADAERDGDRIYALVKGVGTASDGRALGLLTPRVDGEELSLRRAYEAAGVSPQSIGLIEAHGTGTPVGDVTEVQALARAFGPRNGPPRCALGSVKSMISHTMPASGAAGVIKAALALHHKVLPPTLCDEPNPDLELEKTPFYLNTETRPWIHGADTPRRAGVNAFGFGGINAHVILEEYVGTTGAAHPDLMPRWPSELLVLQGSSRHGLLHQLHALEAYTKEMNAVELKDLAYTLNTRPQTGACRLAVVATSVEDLLKKLAYAGKRLADPDCRQIKEREGVYFFSDPFALHGKVAFLFPGEGSQYLNMLSDLCGLFSEVREQFDLMDRAFLKQGRRYLPSDVVFPPPTAQDGHGGVTDEQTLWQMDVGAEAVFAASQGMLALFNRLKIRPDCVVGHSTGEYSALLAAGTLSGEENERQLIRHILELNRIYQEMAARHEIPDGVLLAVGGVERQTVDAVIAAAAEPVLIAMDNCPHQLVLCGSRRAIEQASSLLTSEGAICSPLPFERAYHTSLFQPVCAALKEFFAALPFTTPTIPIYSCSTTGLMPSDAGTIRELALNQWAQPVRFRETIERLFDDGVRIFIEIGPKGNLTGFVDDTLKTQPHLAVASDSHRRHGATQLNHALAMLSAHHVPMDLAPLYHRRTVRRLTLDGGQDRATRREAATGMRVALELHPLRLERRPADATRPMPSPPLMPAQPAAGPNDAVQMTPPSPQTPTHHAADSPRHRALQGYLETMDEFLAMQQSVMERYLSRTARPPSRPSPTPAPTSPSLLPAPAGNGRPDPPARQVGSRDLAQEFPLLGTITHFEPARRLEAVTWIDPTEDIYLLHHTLGGSVSMTDQALTALPVMPLTMTMEIMAQAAAALAPGLHLIRMREIRAYRWITFDRPPVTLLTTAVTQSDAGGASISVQVRERTDSPGVPGPVLAECVADFAGGYPQAPIAGPFPLASERPSSWRPDTLYAEGMFHGPTFRGVSSVDRWGKDGTVATLTVLPLDRLFRSKPSPAWVTDPILLDAAGQLVGFWTTEHLTTGFNVFPFRVRELSIFGPLLPAETRLTCRARIRLEGDQYITSDIDLIGPDGRVHMQLGGWDDRRFDLPEDFYRLRINPRTGYLTRDLTVSRPGGTEKSDLSCALREPFPTDFMDAHAMIWRRVLAHLILGRKERELWRALQGPDKRQIEWLLGRAAAKDAVRRLVSAHFGVELCPADIEILPDADGRPQVSGSWTALTGGSPAVSISHSAGWAAAIAGLPGIQLGIDIEHVDRRPLDSSWERAAFAESELALVSSPEGDRNEWVLRLWCAKEAAAKALGHGLVGDPHALVVQRLGPPAGSLYVSLGEALARKIPDWDNDLIRVRTSRHGGVIVAESTCQRSR